MFVCRRVVFVVVFSLQISFLIVVGLESFNYLDKNVNGKTRAE